MSSPRLTFNLICGKRVTECQNLANLRLSSFAESNQMQQKNLYVSPTVEGSLLREGIKVLLLHLVTFCNE